jgi:hypothetical protein
MINPLSSTGDPFESLLIIARDPAVEESDHRHRRLLRARRAAMRLRRRAA